MRKRKYVMFSLLLLLLILSFSSVCSAEWKTMSNGKIRYYNEEGTKYLKNKWKKLDGRIYRFDANGYVKLGRFKLNGNYYYATFEKGTFVNQRVGNYYFGKKGVMVRDSWQTIKKKKYYFGPTGRVMLGRFSVGGNTYYCTKSTGCVMNARVDEHYYDGTGAMIKNAWAEGYYYGNDGASVYGKLVLGDKLYYITKESGALKNTWYKERYFGADGAMATEQWVPKDGGIVYVNAKGKITKTNPNRKEAPTEDDVLLLAGLVHHESDNQPYMGKLAVASVVVNRMEDPRFPDTLYDVLFQRNQFLAELESYVDYLMSSGQGIDSECMQAAREVLFEGTRLPGYFFFNNQPQTYDYLKIGDHYFSRTWGY